VTHFANPGTNLFSTSLPARAYDRTAPMFLEDEHEKSASYIDGRPSDDRRSWIRLRG
jgi:hypothetical protein